MRSYCFNRYLIAAIFAVSTLLVDAQEGPVLSPYSAYGLGDISPGMFARQRLFGQMGLGVSNPYQVVTTAPSSYANLLRPVFATSMRVTTVKEETESAEFNRQTAQFMGLGFGMPINNGSWGVGFGLLPVTSVGYKLQDAAPLPEGDQVDFEYSGTGGLSRMYGAVAKRLWQKKDTIRGLAQKIVLGAELNYRFGTISNSRSAIYPRNSGYFNTNSTANVIIRDAGFDFSSQYVLVFPDSGKVKLNGEEGMVSRKEKKHDMKLTAGVFYEPAAPLGARRTDLTTSYFTTALGVDIIQDTIEFIDRAEGSITTPGSFGIGAGISIDDKWTYAFEIRQQNWNRLKVDVEGWELPENLGKSTTYSVGVSYTPGTLLNPYGANFFEKTSYCLALRKEDNYLIVNDSQLESYGVSVGASFPLHFSKTRSRFTVGTELGTRGSTDEGGIMETYADFVFGVSITPDLRERWFKKRRID
jgi:hypothetical protein